MIKHMVGMAFIILSIVMIGATKHKPLEEVPAEGQS